MKKLNVLCILYCMSFLSISNPSYQSKLSMPNFFNGFGDLKPRVESSHRTEYGDEVIVLVQNDLGKGLYINGTINSAVYELVEGLLTFVDVEYVFFNSNGGFVNDGLRLGRLMREKGFVTALNRDAQCHSACFLAFIGGRDRLRNEGPSLSMHSPYYIENGRKVFLSKYDPIATEVCDYIKEMVEGKGGEQACFEMMYAKEGTTHEVMLLQEIGVFTETLTHFGYEFVKSYDPSDEIRWYGECFKEAADFKLDDGRCELKARVCKGNIYSDIYVACMRESGYKLYGPPMYYLTKSGGRIIRLQKEWEILGEPKIIHHQWLFHGVNNISNPMK